MSRHCTAPVGVERLEEHEHEDGRVEQVRQDGDPPADLHLQIMHQNTFGVFIIFMSLVKLSTSHCPC